MPDDWNKGLEPSPLELAEFAAHMEWQALPRDQKITRGLDDLLATCRRREQHGGSVSLDILRQIEALRKLLDEVI